MVTTHLRSSQICPVIHCDTNHIQSISYFVTSWARREDHISSSISCNNCAATHQSSSICDITMSYSARQIVTVQVCIVIISCLNDIRGSNLHSLPSIPASASGGQVTQLMQPSSAVLYFFRFYLSHYYIILCDKT